ncbi:MAG: hypothetical protein H7281_08270 [Bacteriovorax sp.]|nr:hypothetical protein [Bacteriovorax sp.]
MKILFCILFTFLAVSARAEQSELPEPNEIFSSYFARITRGGKFPGIYLNAPQSVQESFFKRIKKGSWVGLVDKERKKLEDQGVNLWQDWYQRSNPGTLLLATKENISLAEESYKKMISSSAVKCPGQCPAFQELLNVDWNKLESWKRELWIKNIVLYAPVFNGHTLLWYLSSQYELKEEIVFQNVDVKILDHKKFTTSVHEMGYGGEVYFRGITGPDPKNSTRHWILLDDEFLKTQSPFENTLYQMMEVPGILIHELSHVCQDLEGSSYGYSIEVTSAEDALIIEGMAETYAEEAIYQAGNSMNSINPWNLFIREQGLELVYREGNESSGNLFPYTIGLPFVVSLFDMKNDLSNQLFRKKMLSFLDATPLKEGKTKITLSKWLSELYK